MAAISHASSTYSHCAYSIGFYEHHWIAHTSHRQITWIEMATYKEQFWQPYRSWANTVCDISGNLPIKYLPSIKLCSWESRELPNDLIMLTSVTMLCSQSIDALVITVISFVMPASLTKGQPQFSKTALDSLSTAQGLVNDDSWLIHKSKLVSCILWRIQTLVHVK